MSNFMKKVATPIIIILVGSTALSGAKLAITDTRAETNEKVYYYLHDHLGGIEAVTDENGTIVERKDYLPYGNERIKIEQDPQSSPQSSPQPSPQSESYGFTGKEYDPETNLYYYGSRYYNPTTARFTQIDPLVLGESSKPLASVLENPQALNGYSYVLNNPLRYVDEEGEYQVDFHYHLTYFLGMEAGLDFSDSFEIAYYNQYTDDNPETSPWNEDVQVRANYHFPSKKRVSEVLTSAFQNLDNKEFGTALHIHDDSFSHAGFGPEIGHVLKAWTPDWSWWSKYNKNKTEMAAFSKLFLLREFKKQKYGTGDLSSDDYDKESWQIWDNNKEKITNFINSASLENKLKALYPDLYNEDGDTEKEEE